MKKKEISVLDNGTVSRLNDVLKKDKELNPKYITDVIKSDVYYMINNYFEVEFSDVAVKIDVDNHNQYNIVIDIKGDRLKIMRTIPN